MATKKSKIARFIDGVNHLIRSFKNFVKSSFLSLLIILIILLLLTQMDQAFTMMVDLVENTKFSLFLSFLFINGLAIVLSHFPIYTYYAADLNNSGDYTNWKKVYPMSFWPFKRFPIFVFTTNKDTGYTPDNWANYLRYSIGLLIHIVWIHFIISSFAPNLIFESFPLVTVKIIIYGLLIVPFVLYIIQKEKFTSLTAQNAKDKTPLSEKQKQINGERLNRLYKKLGVWYFVIAVGSGILLLLTLVVGNFSPGGFILILLTSYCFIFNYVFFRLLRTRLSQVLATLQHSPLAPVRFFFKRIFFLQKSENYILLFNLHFVISIVILVYSTIASIKGWNLSNGIPILLSFFYFYYFIIASLGKYFFVTKKMNLFGTRKYRLLFGGATVIVLLLIITNCANIEVRTHELDLVENTKTEVLENRFLDSVSAKNDNTLFFIASHGGGLKANVWTLNVLNRLQQRTNGKLLNQTIAMSGASGGSLGLALYTGLYKENSLDTTLIKKQIDKIAQENYTSLDLSLTFGLDSYRKIWPLSQRIGIRDRPYYAMVKYQKNVENTNNKFLSNTSFRDYWKEAFDKNGYFPSLIMNTAGTTGSRGILWSVKPNEFNKIFPFAKNLADLYDDTKTLPFYQAVSTTNRFPVFSPAAKIPGYGHYIDAGAIDNSGLLGCLDLHIYLLNNKPDVLGDKQVAYVEIINSKSLYVNYLIDKFKEEEQIDHIIKNENESDNIVVDLKTGLNLDKIPGYLSDYITNWENTQQGNIRYFKIFMPHKVSFEDVESFFDGKIENGDSNVVQDLKAFLNKKNNEILALTEAPNKSFFDPWEFYEPTLSRHLSKSSLNYIDQILKHPLLEEQFLEIEKLIHTKRIEKNENKEMAF